MQTRSDDRDCQPSALLPNSALHFATEINPWEMDFASESRGRAMPGRGYVSTPHGDSVAASLLRTRRVLSTYVRQQLEIIKA